MIDPNLDIPEGAYCYTHTKTEWLTEEPFVRLICIPCPYYRDSGDGFFGYCEFYNDEIWDQCKICGINED